MLLSILIPSVFDRNPLPLCQKLLKQIGEEPVELLVFTDNRKRPLGPKRNGLMDMARGQFITHIDDDDDVSDDYVASVLEAIRAHPESDVIVFNQQCLLLGYGFGENPYIVRTGIEFENEDSRMVGDIRVDIHRKPWHWCVWSSALAKSARFPELTMGEDWMWLKQIIPKVRHQHRIDKVLHFYRYDNRKSLSPANPELLKPAEPK